MSTPSTITVNITGQLTLDPQSVEQLIRSFQIQAPASVQPVVTINPLKSSSLRLAFTTKETGEMLGVSGKTVHRLIQRGLLKCSSALRHKRIPLREIERFLKETTN